MFLRWHRRIGVVAAFFVLVLVVTGILLNHAHDLGLDKAPLQNDWLRGYYGLAPTGRATVRYPLSNKEIVIRDGRLHVDAAPLTDCPRFVGVMETQGQVLVVCADRLVLLTPNGELIDQADSLRGIPSGLSAVAKQGDDILLRQGQDSLGVNLADLSVHPVAARQDVRWQQTASLDSGNAAEGITWQRVIQDLHSGRLFGTVGVWLVDAMAIAMAVLALSGALLYFRRRHHV